MATDVGEAITRRISITKADGSAIDADALPTYAVTLPDGSAGTPPTVTHGVTGEYLVNYVPAVAGSFSDMWTATVQGLVAKFGPDSFYVRAGSPTPLLGIAEARRAVGLGVDPSRDETLREYLDAATELIEDHCGRAFRRRTVVEVLDGDRRALQLRLGPVQSITSVVESGTTLTAGDYTTNLSAGLIYRGSTSSVARWHCGTQNVSVTYVVGPAAAAAKVRQAGRVTLQHLWSTQGGASGRPARSTGMSVSDYPPGTGWSLPRAAEELLESESVGGFA